MFELVLIDDKREVVEGLSRAIDWKAMQVSVHGFFSASEAMAYCMEHPPALVITDICMPVMSGMEFTKSLRSVHPEVRVVLLTGYDDFTYAREGIRLGVVEYLSKPVDLDEVQSLVAKEKACWEEQQAEREKQVAESARYRRGLPTLRSQWLKNARSAQPPTRERLQKDFAGMDLPLQAERLLPVAVRICQGEKSDTDLMRYAVENIGCEIIGAQFPCAAIAAGDTELLVLANYTSSSLLETTYKMTQCVRQWRDACKENLHLTFTAGIGMPAARAEELFPAIAGAERVRERELFLGEGSVLPAMDWQHVEAVDPALPAVQEEILKALLQKRYDRTADAVETYIRALRSRENADPLQMREQMLAFLLRIYHEGRAERCLHVETLIDQFGQVHTIDQYREQLLGLISYITGSRDEGGTTGVAEVKHYIDEHYSEEITLKTMSELVHLSPAYLSYAFKEEFDINFNDYLTAVRIEQAKHLLTQTDLKVYEVCAKVGYKDKKYFTDLFKKHTGMLPRDRK